MMWVRANVLRVALWHHCRTAGERHSMCFALPAEPGPRSIIDRIAPRIARQCKEERDGAP
jgi:hypothetical protein